MNQVLIWLVAEWARAGRALLPQMEIGIVGEDVMSHIEDQLKRRDWMDLAQVDATSGVAILII